jgi:hypothetical protein
MLVLGVPRHTEEALATALEQRLGLFEPISPGPRCQQLIGFFLEERGDTSTREGRGGERELSSPDGYLSHKRTEPSAEAVAKKRPPLFWLNATSYTSPWWTST